MLGVLERRPGERRDLETNIDIETPAGVRRPGEGSVEVESHHQWRVGRRGEGRGGGNYDLQFQVKTLKFSLFTSSVVSCPAVCGGQDGGGGGWWRVVVGVVQYGDT